MMTESVTTARPPPSISADTLKKIMWLYRTRTCPLNKRGQCNYGKRCFDSHESQPERRAPKQNEYNDWHPSTMKCTSNVPNENCKYGRACYFAHNDFEVNYHPTLYKTKICNQFEKEGTCLLGMICPNYHYIDEQRKIEKGTLSADCKSDGLSRKAPPPQEFRRWLDEELRLTKKANINKFIENNGTSTTDSNNNIQQINNIVNDNKLINTSNGNNVNVNVNVNLINNDDLKDIPNGQDIVDKIISCDDDNSNNNSNQYLNENKKQLNVNVNVNGNGNGDRERNSQPNIENEVEIELPSSQPSQSLNLSQPDLMLRNVSDSSSMQFNSEQQIDDKWHQGNNNNNNNNNVRYNNNQSRPEHYLASSASPHLNRALSTPSSLPSVPHSNNINNNNNSFQPLNINSDPQRIHYSHSHGHTLSTASFRSGRSGRSSGNHSQISGKSGKSGISNKSGKSGKSGKSHKSKKSKRSERSNKTKSSKSSKKSTKSVSTKSKSSGKSGKSGKSSHHKKSIRKLENKRLRLEQKAIEIVKSYKISPCQKNKCNDIYCHNYHNYDDRRRSPFQFNYCHEACSRIFDNKTKKFTDNGYGCPMNENCEYAHNYLEIWYHPNVFHTKQCPIMKYQKSCPWKFKCSHFHKKTHKRTRPVGFNHNINSLSQQQQQQQLIQQQRPSTYSPISSSAYSSHSYHGHPPPNLHQHINHQNGNNGHNHNGPQRPPLTNTNRHHHHHQNNKHEISSPYSNNNNNNNHNNMNPMNLGNNGHNHQQMRNGLISPNKSSQHDSSYSYNPLMQGIAPSINSWRQKTIDGNY
mmetsp:Transcript_50255/g.45040  ORF Transcript_50255/g.45040 Transcript_50255/m.45040 type:complete len:805 (+) Transcript_50255:82-2496(+)